MKYSGYVMKRVPGCECGHERATWVRVKVLDGFYSNPKEFLLNLATAIEDKKWIEAEKKKWAGCKPKGGTLTYKVVFGRPTEGVCVSDPRHKAVGFAGRRSYKVYL
jgi:hypothetical protein